MPDKPRRDRCPVCGQEFDPVKDVNICPNHTYPNTFTPDELISEDDDYAYCI